MKLLYKHSIFLLVCMHVCVCAPACDYFVQLHFKKLMMYHHSLYKLHFSYAVYCFDEYLRQVKYVLSLNKSAEQTNNKKTQRDVMYILSACVCMYTVCMHGKNRRCSSHSGIVNNEEACSANKMLKENACETKEEDRER